MTYTTERAEKEALKLYKAPTDGAAVPKANHRPKQILTKEQMETFLATVDRNEIWRDFFYTELTTGLRRGEICGLMWQDFDEKTGTLKIVRSVSNPRAGVLECVFPAVA